MSEKQVFSMSERELLEGFSTSSKGLSDGEAKKRLRQNGKNRLEERRKKGLKDKIIEHFKSPMVIVLIASAVVSCAAAIVKKETYEFFEFAFILVILILNAALALVQERRAENAFEELKELDMPYSLVRRGGVLKRIKSEDLVLGDVVILSDGDKVPADLRLTFTVGLRVNEAFLTGVSAPVEKDALKIPDENARLLFRHNMAYRGSSVVYGRGEGVVVAVGKDSEEGKIAQTVTGEEKPSSPLGRFIDGMIKFLSVVAVISAAAVFVCALIKKVPFSEAFLSSAAIAVASFPEGMPVIASIIFAASLKELGRKNAVIRRIESIETLGACDVVCTGKTGIITLNRTEAREIFTLDTGKKRADFRENEKLALCAVLCNDCSEEGVNGNSAEEALLYSAALSGYDVQAIREKWRRTDEIPFDGERKIMTTVNTDGENSFVFVKGAVKDVLRRCSDVLKGGEVCELSEADKEEIINASNSLSEKGRRIMAFAYKEQDDFYERGLTFIALVSFIDPVAEGTKEAVERCRKKGIRPVMITGDEPLTAKYAAKKVGIYKEGDLVLTGDEIKKMTDGELSRAIEKCSLFAYADPESKVRIVREFKRSGRTVAMTGDGVNDAPSMREADVGVFSGTIGSEEAREASSVIVTDGKFSSVVGAVGEGRRIYHSVVKAAQYLVSSNIAEVLSHLIISIFLLSNGQEFLSPVMILWINLVTDCLPAVSIGAENDGRGAPKPNGYLKARTVRMTCFQGLIKTAIVVLLYVTGRNLFGHKEAVTMCFIGQCMMQLFHSYNMKSQTRSLFSGNPFLNVKLNLSFLLGTALLVGATLLPVVSELFHVASLGVVEWGISLAFAFAIIPFVEAEKIFERKASKRVEMAQNR